MCTKYPLTELETPLVSWLLILDGAGGATCLGVEGQAQQLLALVTVTSEFSRVQWEAFAGRRDHRVERRGKNKHSLMCSNWR